MEGYEDLTPAAPDIPICILHGWHDDIVPVGNSIRYGQACSATLHIVDGDHRLTDNIKEINEYLERFLAKIGK
jgi:pimeloyl-ACP methyl ester carboxylesterase